MTDNSDRIVQQIEQTSGFYSPVIYDLLTRFGSLTTQADPLSDQFVGTTSVNPKSATQTLPFVVGFLPPSSPPSAFSVSREANITSTPPTLVSDPSGASQTRTATTGGPTGNNGGSNNAGVNGQMAPGDPGSNGGPPVANQLSFQQAATVISAAYQARFGSVPDANTLAMLTCQSWRETSGNWRNNNPGFIGSYQTPSHVPGQYSPSSTQSTFGFVVEPPPGGSQQLLYFNTYTTPQAGASAFLANVANRGPALQAAASGDVSAYCQAMFDYKYTTTTPGPYAAAFPNFNTVKAAIGDPSTLPSTSTIPNPLTGINTNASSGTWQQDNGSGNAQTSASQSDSVANQNLNLQTQQGQQFQQIQNAEAKALQALIQQMTQTPPLRLLVNPRSFKNSLEKVIADGNWGRNGPIIEHWGEALDKVEGAGKIAAFYALDVGQSPVGDTNTAPGITRMARNYSTSYQNLLSLYLIYRNNGGIWMQDSINPNTTQTNLAVVGSLYVFYDNILYVGSFDNFSISESDDAPYSLEYSFTFTVRAWFCLDQQQNPQLAFQPPVSATAAPGIQPQPGAIPSSTIASQALSDQASQDIEQQVINAVGGG